MTQVGQVGSGGAESSCWCLGERRQNFGFFKGHYKSEFLCEIFSFLNVGNKTKCFGNNLKAGLAQQPPGLPSPYCTLQNTEARGPHDAFPGFPLTGTHLGS